MLEAPAGDGEALGLAARLDEVLKRAGWKNDGGILQWAVSDPPIMNTRMHVPEGDTPATLALLSWLHNVGFRPEGLRHKTHKQIEVIVWHQAP